MTQSGQAQAAPAFDAQALPPKPEKAARPAKADKPAKGDKGEKA